MRGASGPRGVRGVQRESADLSIALSLALSYRPRRSTSLMPGPGDVQAGARGAMFARGFSPTQISGRCLKGWRSSCTPPMQTTLSVGTESMDPGVPRF